MHLIHMDTTGMM